MSKKENIKYPGTRQAMDGNSAVIMCERESSDAAGAYPITPSTQMGEFWAVEAANGHVNISDRPLIFVEPESEHAAAGVTAGMAMTGLRATNFSSAQGVAFMHESLYAAAGKHLPYVLNMGCRAITKASLNVHCAHDDYHCVDDTGMFQLMASSAQEAADMNIIAHKLSELALIPGVAAQDGFLTTHLIESLNVPERALIKEFLGRPDDIINTPTPAQKILYGEKRRRIPAIWDVDNPVSSGSVQNQDAYMQAVAAQRPYFVEHVPALCDQVMDEFAELTGRQYGRISTYKTEGADYVIVGQGSIIPSAQEVADYLNETRGLKIGVLNLTMFRPFPGNLVSEALKGKKGVVILERTDQPMAEDLPIARETRASISKSIENGIFKNGEIPHPDYEIYSTEYDAPRIYSGSFGLGSRDLQPEGIIAAIENMLPGGKHKKFFYLSVDFLHEEADSPKQELYQDELLEAYPGIKDLALRGSENPNLMPKGSITVRMHSVGGWGAITTGKNLAMTLFELLDYDIKANPKYGSEKKGQPTTYYLSAAPEPIRINCEYNFVDVVLSPDPNVFGHSNPLFGLKKGGELIIQSHLDSPEAVWNSFPAHSRRFIVENDINVHYIDAFKIAREEASNPELQFRMQGIAFQGAFFAASPVMENANLNEKSLFRSIEAQLNEKFGHKGQRVVEDNLRVVRRGFDEIVEIKNKPLNNSISGQIKKESHLPITLKQLPNNETRISDVHRFWEQTGSFYSSGKGSDNIVDPFIGMSLVPASTGIYRDMTAIRFEHPTWVPENCTACGNCYTICPDSAIPGLVNSISEVFETTVQQIERGGMPTRHIRRALRTVEKKLRDAIVDNGDSANINTLIKVMIEQTLDESDLDDNEKGTLALEFDRFNDIIADFKFASTKPYFSNREKKNKGSGGLFSITINPYTCKGCMECIDVCDDEALVVETQTEDSTKKLRDEWEYWLTLPTTAKEFIRIDDIDEKIGALDTLLLDKSSYASMVCGDGACIGCGEKTIIHLFTSTVTTMMQGRVKKHLEKIDELINGLEKHIRMKLVESLDLSDTSAINNIVEEHQDIDLTLSRLTSGMDVNGGNSPIDSEWLMENTQLLEKLKHLKWQYTNGVTNSGRSNLGMINATGCTSVWGSTFPYNPYPFPWSSNLFQDSPSVAMGLFEGHMVKMADGFKAIRRAELELSGKYNPEIHEPFLTYFDWKQFSDEEYKLCPPVVSVGGDGAMYDIGFQNLSRMMMSGMPIKVMVLDTQVYSNTGGQACTSTYISQVADMTPYGKQQKGKEEVRKEMSVIAMAHRTTFVHQSSLGNINHMIEGFIDGMNSRRPALFNTYAVCQPEHGVADDATARQSKMALESRAYPAFCYDPDRGVTFEDCCDVDGNPSKDSDWVTYDLKYIDDKGKEASMTLPFTFADFALTEGRFVKQFKKAPPETWNDDMVLLSDFINLDEADREDKFPYIWAADKKGHLMRVLVTAELVTSTIERRDFWRQVQSLSGLTHAIDTDRLVEETRIDMAQKLTTSLLAMASGGSASDLGAALAVAPSNGGGASAETAADFEPVWIETPECTACDECIDINPKIFAYNDDKKAVIVDPKAGPFSDIVKAAEKCTAEVIHPGTPFNPNEANIDKLVQRAAKFQ